MTDNPDMVASPKHGFVSVNDLRLHYLDYGGDGKPLLLLHGVTSHAWIWCAVAPEMNRRHSIALDSRGHGDSQWSADHQYTTEDLASDVIEFIDVMNIGGLDIVGASWGGLVALNAAMRRPDLVDRLVLIDIPPSFSASASEVDIDPRSFRNHDESVAYVSDSAEYMDDGIAQTVATSGVRPGASGLLYPKHDEYFHDYRPHRNVDYWEGLESLRMPVLIVRAENSSHLSASVAEHMAGIAYDGQLVTISETGHRIPTDNPVALGAVLRHFLGA